jgi:hypothetical protein
MASKTWDRVGRYGPTWREGILAEHVIDAEQVHALGVPVLCGEIVWIQTEDGRMDGRCGGPVTGPDGWTCESHTPEEGWDAECEHGMTLALCSGPMHF